MKRSLNLMSEKSRKRVQVRNCLRLWSRIVACFALILVVVGIVQWRVCAAGDSKVASAEAEYEPIRQLKIENGRLKTQIQAMKSSERIPLALSQNQPLLALVGLATQAVSQQQSRLYLNKMEIERQPISLKPTDRSGLSFTVEGISNNKDAITSLVNTLKAVGPFDAVAMNSQGNQRPDESAQHAFSIQATN